MDLATLKAYFQTKIGAKTAAGSIYPIDITDCLDALADSVDAGDIGGSGAVAPLVSSATCPNGAANTVVVVFNQSMTAVTTAGWSFKKNGSAWSISSVAGSGTTWTFTMGSSAVNGDTLLRSYDSGTGATIGTSLELVSFTDSAVTNSVSAVAPTVVSATCPNGAANTVVVVFSQSMTAVTTAGWSFKKNGSAWSVSSVTGSGTTWTFTMGSSAVNGDTLLRSYDSTTGATIGTSLELVSFTDSAVTNSVGDVAAPTVSEAVVLNADPDTIRITFNEAVTGVSATGWSFKKNGSAWTISTVTGSGTVWYFNMASAAAFGDVLKDSYDSTTGATIDGASNELGSFTDNDIDNQVAAAFSPTYLTWSLDDDYETYNTAKGLRLGSAIGDNSVPVIYATNTFGVGDRLVVKTGETIATGGFFQTGLHFNNTDTGISSQYMSLKIDDAGNIGVWSDGAGNFQVAEEAITHTYYCLFKSTGTTIKFQKSNDGVTWTDIGSITDGSLTTFIYASAFGFNELDGILEIFKLG